MNWRRCRRWALVAGACARSWFGSWSSSERSGSPPGSPSVRSAPRGIIASFEASNAIDIGVVDAVGAIPVIVVATAVSLVLLAAAVVRGAARRPVAVTLRGAA